MIADRGFIYHLPVFFLLVLSPPIRIRHIIDLITMSAAISKGQAPSKHQPQTRTTSNTLHPSETDFIIYPTIMAISFKPLNDVKDSIDSYLFINYANNTIL